MIFDFDQASVIGNILIFPDFAFGALPKQPSQLEENTVIQGSMGGTSISIGGSVSTSVTGTFLGNG